jgi:medium-chain acyl-[acyl-carrier-protein] hydrolase
VEVCPVELPGHGYRLRETPFTDLISLVRVAAQALLPALDKPFALFGHSMGATICFELARALRAEHQLKPVHLFISSRPAPQMRMTEPRTYDLPDAQFLAELHRLNGTPNEVLAHPELMQLMLPLLRADFQMIETYTYLPQPPLECPLMAFGGLQDAEVNREQLAAWREQTTEHFSLRLLPGDHFFLRTNPRHLLETLAQALSQHARELSRAARL